MKKRQLMPFDINENSILNSSIRLIESSELKRAWENAKAFGITYLVNTCCDKTFERYVTGLLSAQDYIKNYNPDMPKTDYAVFVLSSVKTALAVDKDYYRKAYTDMMLSYDKKAQAVYRSADIGKYFEMSDNKAYEENSFYSSSYTYDKSEHIQLLQTALNKAGLTDKFGNPLDEDGKFGPNTYYAVINLKQIN